MKKAFEVAYKVDVKLEGLQLQIAIITDAWHPQVNGVVTTLKNTVECLAKFGHTTDIIEPSQYAGFPLPMLDGLRFSVPPYNFIDRLRGADAIHIVTEGSLGIPAKLFCDRFGLTYTTAFHTNYAVYFNKNFGVSEDYGFKFLRWFHRNSKSMMVPSKSMIRTLHDKGFQNAVHWRRGVDTSIFHPTENRRRTSLFEGYGPAPYWLNVGRVSKEKNLDAFLSLDLSGTKIVVGDGPDRAALSARYPDVVFLGKKSGHELGECYRAADVFVFPSLFDTYGLVMAEAISCGTPVAGFRVTGPIDVVEDHVTGVTDDDLGVACRAAYLLPRPHQLFDWETATSDFVSHLAFVKNSSR